LRNEVTMLLLFLAQAAALPQCGPPPPVDQPIFSYSDYPPEALRNGWEGSVVADLTVGQSGAVCACKIIKTSGHEVLDDVTCDLLVRRARFKPPKDKHGNPIVDTVRTPPIEWRIRR
jgi:protein TonB